MVVDRRDHLGGNAYDREDKLGVLTHQYGPHYFRTNSQRIIDYLSAFTGWREVEYKIKSYTDGRYWSFPINLNTFEELVGRPSSTEEFERWLEKERVDIKKPANSEEVIISQVGVELYEKFFRGYTLKQWKCEPRELDASVCGRIPIRTNRDDRYLKEEFQALPKQGYTAMFERMLEASPKLELHLGVDLREAKERWDYRHLVFTGPIDEYYERRHGELPYRSLNFEWEGFTAAELEARREIAGKAGFWQPAMQVNYPDKEVPHTRIVEIKHATGQDIAASSIMREYPMDWTPEHEPYYPIPNDESSAQYKKYAELAKAEEDVSFIGRLATYRYYNMDQVTGMALAEADRLLAKYGEATE